jgi:hypothetical protein
MAALSIGKYWYAAVTQITDMPSLETTGAKS